MTAPETTHEAPQGPALRVGDIRSRRPAAGARRAPLSRLVLKDEAGAAEAVRNALYENPAIDIVDDPLGLFHEAVPQEALIYTGAPAVARALALSLPRFFGPLTYRRLSFEIRQSEGAPSLLFGDLLEPGLGAPRGQMQIRWQDQALDSAGTPWRAGQGRAVIALGQGPKAEGLMRVGPANIPAEQALVVTPGTEGPHVTLRALAPLAGPGRIGPVLGDPLDQATVSHDAGFATYHASFAGTKTGLRLIPDSQFSRLLTRPRPGVDLLEVLGVFLPTPGRVPAVEGLALRLDPERRLMAHEARAESWRVVLTARGERLVLRADGQRREMPRGQVLPDLALRLRPATELDASLSRRWLALGAEGGEPLGWIPLRLHDAPPQGSNLVRESAIRHARTAWCGPEDTDAAGAAIHLDWLDQAVPMVLRDGEGGTRASGLAAWALDQGEVCEAALRAGGGQLHLDRPRRTSVVVEDREVFRLGLLWVRLHRPSRREG